MARDRGLEASVAEAAREAVREADVVVTAGPILRPPHATIKAGWLKPGAFGCAVDYDSYFDRAAVEECRLATDDRVQFAEFIRSGYLDVPEPDADLGELVTGRRQGRERPEQKTMAMNLGSALVDVAVADLVYRHCAQAGLGLLLPD
jgi:ornithine cyclodeaminase